MSAKHTPGPWSLDLCDEGGFAVCIEPRIDMGWHAVITSRGPWGHRAEESHANARLIAAAPDLLTALSAIADNSHDPQAIRVARTAIAKATGAEA